MSKIETHATELQGLKWCAPNCYIRLVSGLHFATSLLHALNSVEVANFLDNNTIHHLMQFGVLCNLMCRGSGSRNFSSNS